MEKEISLSKLMKEAVQKGISVSDIIKELSKEAEDGKYGWEQVSQGETVMKRDHVVTVSITSGISKAVCTYVLVREYDLGEGCIKRVRVHKDLVTEEKLALAGEVP